MAIFADAVLLLWPLVILLCFSAFSPRAATLTAMLGAWLFLPMGGFVIPGLPNYTKMSAATLGTLAGAFLFSSKSFGSLRLCWLDMVMTVYITCPFPSSMLNDLGAYDGLSATINKLITWGFPYLVGRVCFRSHQDLRGLANAVVIGGLLYIPLCLFENRMSPQLHSMIYGWHPGSFANTSRGGGWRPVVFMQDGLATAMWMSFSSLCGLWLWTTGTLKNWFGLPSGLYCFSLLVTTILCRSFGAFLIMATGYAWLFATKIINTKVLLWATLLICPTFIAIRATGVWEFQEIVSAIEAFSEDRAQSFRFRVDNENLLAAKAMVRPLFGWGGWGRNRIYNEDGRDISITDSLWIIEFGVHGFIGLISLYLLFLTPLGLLLKRYSSRELTSPQMAPVVVLAVGVVLYAIDCLVNGMLNPIYTMTIGALASTLQQDRNFASTSHQHRGPYLNH